MPLEHLSHSSIQAFQMCPQSWKFRYIDGIKGSNENMRVGTFAHNVLEESLRNDIPLEESLLKHELESEHYMAFSDDSRSFLSGIMKNTDLTDFAGKLTPKVMDYGPALEHKIYFEVPGVPIPVMGYLDVLTDEHAIVDWKTSGKSWTQARADAEMQASFYATALYSNGIVPASESIPIFYPIMVKTKTPKFQLFKTFRTIEDMFHVHKLVATVYKAITGEAFWPNNTTWKCSPKHCEAWSVCEGGRLL